MSTKMTLAQEIVTEDATYHLAYVPGISTYIRPDFSGMRAVSSSCDRVQLPVGPRHMVWAIMELPAQPGTAVPARIYLMFRFFEHYHDPKIVPLHEMVVYNLIPKDTQVSPAQKFINAWAGAAPVQKQADDWVNMFQVAEPVAPPVAPMPEPEEDD